MAGKPPGSNVYLYIDAAEELKEDDVVRTPSGRCYRVVSNRIQTRGIRIGRQHLRAIVQEPDFTPDEDDFVLDIHWYSRNRKKTS